MSIMNYNEWFHQYHRYLEGYRNGKASYNDTKWNTINERYKNLVDISSTLLDEQPYGVVGNYVGFQQLNQLIQESGYTYDDVDTSFMDMYRMNLQNAMGNMLVNTHAVIAHYNQRDKKHVYNDPYGHYYIIDVPFVQLHFGERDEFIRQKLHEFYETENQYYMPSDKFLSDEISSILGFTLICCVNGMMSDDWFVGVDEKGFRIKIGWKYAADATFTIYKLDESRVFDITGLTYENVANRMEIPFELMGIDASDMAGQDCIVQISDTNIRKDVLIVPNFGHFTSTGFQITNLQDKTVYDLQSWRTKDVKLRIYAIKYLREISGIFPAVNYLELLGTHLVYNDKYQHITNDSGELVYARETNITTYESNICTPPISPMYDYTNIKNHDYIRDAYNIIGTMEQSIPEVSALATACNTRYSSSITTQTEYDFYDKSVIQPAKSLYQKLQPAYQSYIKAAIISSLIPREAVAKFERILTILDLLRNADHNYRSIQRCLQSDILFDEVYQPTIKEIVKPLVNPPFSTLGQIYCPEFLQYSYDAHTLLRPIAEQCFIVMKYNSDDDMRCWVFDVPNIKHFNGIENVFYIDEDLTGEEVYKFFYLYTKTEAPVQNPYIDTLTFAESIDFDKFMTEIHRFDGYIKYWNATNRLAKLSMALYQKYDDDTVISILSKILKNEISAETFTEYPSEINYEVSNASSDNVDGFTEYSQRAPFALNFMFYTLQMLNGNKDQLQSYFMDVLTRKEFYPRYMDLALYDIFENTPNPDAYSDTVDFSTISFAPFGVYAPSYQYCQLPDENEIKTFTGVNFPIDISNHSLRYIRPILQEGVRYPWVFNTYRTFVPHTMMTPNSIAANDPYYYMEFNNIDSYISYPELKTNTFCDDAQIAKMMSVYAAEMYPGFAEIFTDYKNIWDKTTVVQSMMKTIERHTTIVHEYIQSRGSKLNFRNPSTQTLIDIYLTDGMNELHEKLSEIETRFISFKVGTNNNNIFSLVSKISMMLNKIYEITGYDREAIRRVRAVYIHLKKINDPMSYYEYKNWLNGIDMETLMNIDSYFSDNPFIIYTGEQIKKYAEDLSAALVTIQTAMVDFDDYIMPEFVSIYESFVSDITSFCNDIVQNYIFDLYTMNPISINAMTLNKKPAFAEIRINADDPHVDFGLTDDYKTHNNVFELTFSVQFDTNGNQYVLYHAIPTCVYAFKSNTPMTVDLYVYAHDETEITMIPGVEITFSKVGTSADVDEQFSRYSNGYMLPLEVQNVHESFDVNNLDDVVNTRHAEMNYELLCGNRFAPLNHTSEFCAPFTHKLQGPIDKLYVSCEQVNYMTNMDQTNRPSKSMFFQPSLVFHIQPSNHDVITSIGGKYFAGQRIYAVTDDGLNLIPLIITSVDHSQERGMLEARVDLYRAKWFETTDPQVMEHYLTNDITCTIIPDNIQNFMDEFTDYDGPLYPIPEMTSTAALDQRFIELPGDPYFVETHADYVYTRLEKKFPEYHTNSADDPYHRFIYIGSGDTNFMAGEEHRENYIMVNMINHDFNPLTLPELYPVLRDEPDDLPILKKERKLFDTDYISLMEKYYEMEKSPEYEALKEAVFKAETEPERVKAQIELARYVYEMIGYIQSADYYKNMHRDLETPTTWYNVRAYEDALVYINNGRAKLFSNTFQRQYRDIFYSDDLEIRLYDWEHRTWIDPSKYTIEMNIENGVSIDPVCEYKTNNVLTSIKIVFNTLGLNSKRILIYLVYSSKDQFDIPLNDMECTVRFRPVLSLRSSNTNDLDKFYRNVKIRKHYDANETYEISLLDPLPEEFGSDNGFVFYRPKHNGTFTDGSPIRFCDMNVMIDNVSYTYDDFDIYVKNPIPDTTVDQVSVTNTFTTSISRDINDFTSGETVVLIPISNTDDIMFNGVASNIMFIGTTSVDENEVNQIDIISCTKTFTENKTILCTMLPSSRHQMSGGVIRVQITKNTSVETAIKNWIHLTSDAKIEYRLIPDTVALIPKSTTVTDNMRVILRNNYQLDTDHIVSSDNTNKDDLFTYYYDKYHKVRYPFANIRKNKIDQRLTIDPTLNENVNTIRTNHISVSRYITQHIPQDGIIDLTGKIPTPLSRDRYEIWVNGRQVYDDQHITILSPTTFQLRNMISLKNLEVIELIDDVDNTILTPTGPVYIDIDGAIYTSYIEMMKHHANLIDQSVQYYFNQTLHSDMDTYVIEPYRNPNNKDYEEDILNYLTFDDTIMSYDELHNIPTINGNDVYNMTSETIGFMELPNDIILHMFDDVWKYEILNGALPLSHAAQYFDTNVKEQYLHVIKNPNSGFDIYTTGLEDHPFTLYISTQQDADIDSNYTRKIIPMVRQGVLIHIDDTFENMWLHSTNPTAEPIQIK